MNRARIRVDSRSGVAKALAVVIVMLMALPAARAATLGGVSVPDQATVMGKTLVLNGVGLRTASILNVKVYVIGLYLESKRADPKAIIESSQTKRVAMHFVRDVSAKQLRDGWSQAFEKNYADVASIKAEIEKFNQSMRDAKNGDSIVLDFSGETVDVSFNGTKVDSVNGSAFQRAALGIWLGPKPPNEELKAGILGN